MSDEKCCCPDANSPSIKNGGNSPTDRDNGPQKVMLTASSGTSPDGEAIAMALPVGPKGLKIELGGTFLVKQAAIDDFVGSDPYAPTINAILRTLRAIGAIEN